MHQGYDSREEFICSLGIRVMIPQMILCVLIALQPMIQRSFYYINTSEIPSELSRENFISSHVKITCYLHT